MTEADLTEAGIRRFLLGDLDDAERQEMEEVFISDAEAKTRILMAEDDLIEDYLEDSLSPVEKEKFLAYYLSAPQQQRKLRIAKSLKGYAVAHAGARTFPAPRGNITTSGWRSYLSELKKRHRLLFIPLTAILVIAIVSGAVWLVQLQRLNARLAQEDAQRLAIEQELREVNTGQVPSPNPVVSLVLAPVTVRSLRPPTEVGSSAKAEILELGLILAEKDKYSNYQAVLQRAGVAQRFTISNLHAQEKTEGQTVLLRIPLRILTRGVYQILLSGIGPDGKPSPPVEYTFVMNDGSTTAR